MKTRVSLLFCFCSLLAVLACTPAEAPKEIPSEGFAGTWVMKLGSKTFVVLSLEKSGDTFTGTLMRPKQFQTANGVRFSHFSSDAGTETVVSASTRGDQLHLVTRNPADKEDEQEYDMTLIGQDAASIQMADPPLEPWPFTRVRSAQLPAVSTDWEPRRSYSVDDGAPSNAEMQRLYEEDQLARKDFLEFSKEAEAIGHQDEERRNQTRTLLADGKLHTAEDFTRAAFIFQHGNSSDDFLLAHTLAMIAAAKGDEDALWIGTATLDRYLHSSGKPQIFGTQIKEKADHTATLEPYNRKLVDDRLRRELGVQPIATQEEQLQDWTERFRAAASKPK